MKSAKTVVAIRREVARREQEELAFLPAALEIVETPPSPVGRTITATIIALFLLAAAWACLGQIDIVASATGKILPSGRTKVIQPFETGVVRAIHVHDGQRVSAGEPLIELDATMNLAERNHLQSDLMSAQLDAARLRALLDVDDPVRAFVAPAGAGPAQVETQRRFLINQVAEQRAKLAALDSQRAQKAAERDTIQATITKLETTLPVLEQRVEIRKILSDHETGSKANYLEIFQALIDQQQDLEVQKSRYKEAEAALAAMVETRAQTVAEYRRMRHTELAEAERKAGGLRDDVVKSDRRAKFQLLTAPVDGTVQQLAVHTVGGVVTPGQALLAVVPADSRLEIEAMVSNRDKGFVHAGQEAAIKVDTFSFTKYGLLHGSVLSVSDDAITRDNPPDRQTDKPQSTETASSEPKGRELIYAARVSLDRTRMWVEDGSVNLSPGMAVTVEIKTGERRIISYLLSPVLRFWQESLRER